MVLLAGAALLLLYAARSAVLLIYVSAILAIGFSPLVRMLERRVSSARRWHPPRWLAILAVYVVMLGSAALVVALVIPPLISQGQQLATDAPALLDALRGQLRQYGIDAPTLDELARKLPNATQMLGAAFGTFWSLFGGVVGVITILILTFYLLVDSQDLVEGTLRLVAREKRGRIRNAGSRITTKVSAWLAGQLILAAVIGTTTAAALWLLGIPYIFVLAVLAALGELIPFVGPLIAAFPAIAVAAATGWHTALWTALFFLAQQQLENHVLVPKLMSRQVGLSPALVMMAIIVGAALLGVAGAVLALPTAAIAQVIMQETLTPED